MNSSILIEMNVMDLQKYNKLQEKKKGFKSYLQFKIRTSDKTKFVSQLLHIIFNYLELHNYPELD